MYQRTIGTKAAPEPSWFDNPPVRTYIYTTNGRTNRALTKIKMEFLSAVTSKEATSVISAFSLPPKKTETVPITSAIGRILAEDIIATEDVPPFARSLVDGFAVRVKDVYGARETTPSLLVTKGEVQVGEETSLTVASGEAVYVATGAMLPAGADGVVMQEQTRQAGRDLEVTKPVHKAENICFQGEDIRKGSQVMRGGMRISPFSLGVLAALGIAQVPVYKVPAVALISSGNEIVPVDAPLRPGKVHDINGHAISGLVASRGASVRSLGIAADTVEEIAGKIEAAREFDLILLSGGSSKGQSDFVTMAIERLGGEILFHGINVRPGKPTIFAKLWGKPVFGLPGHPVSCSLVAVRFVFPLLAALAGENNITEYVLPGRLEVNVPSTYGVEEYVRVKVARGEHGYLVSPLFAKSAVISMLAEANGYIVVPEGKEGLEAGEEVEVYPFG
jgi:molybdopterin molybdotransferase